MAIRTERAYEDHPTFAGRRFLVDRLWPRGVRKEDLHLDGWLKEAAPSDRLRRWFGHDPDRWDEFVRRYWRQLDESPEVWMPLRVAAQRGAIVLIFAAKDEERNNAVALKQYLEQHLPGRGGAARKVAASRAVHEESRPKRRRRAPGNARSS